MYSEVQCGAVRCSVSVQVEELAEVLNDAPAAKANFLKFGKTYRTLHFLAKARRKLTPEELDKVDVAARELGHIFPTTFKGSVTPKVHELIHHVPQLARSLFRPFGLFLPDKQL